MIETVEDFLRSFITSTADIPARPSASLDAEELADILMTIIEVNGVHDSDEDGAAPLPVRAALEAPIFAVRDPPACTHFVPAALWHVPRALPNAHRIP